MTQLSPILNDPYAGFLDFPVCFVSFISVYWELMYVHFKRAADATDVKYRGFVSSISQTLHIRKEQQ